MQGPLTNSLNDIGPAPTDRKTRSSDSQSLGSVRRRLLVAEDHEISRELAGMMVARLGAEIDLACDGIEAVALIERASRNGNPYSLALMDIQMPLMNGLEATRRLRDLGFSAIRLPILALSASANPEDIAACHAAGMQAHLSKPVSLEDLRLAIESWSPDSRTISEMPVNAPAVPLQVRYELRKRALADMIGAALKSGDTAAATVDEILAMLHKLAGTAGYFGEGSLSIAVAELEAELAGTAAAEIGAVLERCRSLLTRHLPKPTTAHF